MAKIIVNDRFDFDVESDKNGFVVNGVPVSMNTSQVNAGQANILLENKSYNAELVSVGEDKTIVVKVNNEEYSVRIEDKYESLLKQLGMDYQTSGKISDLKAPMPGLVLDVFVQEGQEIAKGENLIVLEAMKMENILKAPADARVAKILVKKGDKLEKGSTIIQFG